MHVEQLAADLGVSQATIRRDLAALDHESLLRRTHGGASQPDTGVELPVRYRDTQGREPPESYEMVGAWTERFLENLNFSIAIMGVDGISAAGGPRHTPAPAARCWSRTAARGC